MWGVNTVKNTAQKISDLIFEEKDEYEEIFEEEETVTAKNKDNVRMERTEMKQRVVGDEAAAYTVPQFVSNKSAKQERPKLTVHESPSLQIKVFKPRGFDEVRHIADCLKSKQAVVINYELTEMVDMVRISDFMNGACYVLQGHVQPITRESVLYVPHNVTISKDMFDYSSGAAGHSMPSFGKVSEG